MPVLSWHVFGGHSSTVSLLRDFSRRKGGSGNSKTLSLLDFNAVFVDERAKDITVMDVVEGIIARNEDWTEDSPTEEGGLKANFFSMRRLLREESAWTAEDVALRSKWTKVE